MKKFTFTLMLMILGVGLFAQNNNTFRARQLSQTDILKYAVASSNPNFQPAEAYRIQPTVPDIELKYTYEYDSYGHVTLETLYVKVAGAENYQLYSKRTISYQLLNNGVFVKTLEMEELDLIASRYTASYDNKGMLLWEQEEEGSRSNLADNWTWDLILRDEAVIESGIRTGMKTYDPDIQTMVPDTRYTFDSKGRVISFSDSGLDWAELSTYTWSNDDKITSYSYSDGEMTATYSNIVFVHNAQYLNPYSLDPFSPGSVSDSNSGSVANGNEISNSIWNQPFFNADVTVSFEGLSVNYKITSNVTEDEILTSYFDETGTTLLATETIGKTDANGSFELVTENFAGGLLEESYMAVEFNEYGAVTRVIINDYDLRFERTYDADKPTETTVYINDVEFYTETYTAWKNIATQLKNKEATKSLSVYPNPTSGKSAIETSAPVQNVTVYSMNGTLQKQISNTTDVDISELSSGLYFLQIKTTEGMVSTKILKK